MFILQEQAIHFWVGTCRLQSNREAIFKCSTLNEPTITIISFHVQATLALFDYPNHYLLCRERCQESNCRKPAYCSSLDKTSKSSFKLSNSLLSAILSTLKLQNVFTSTGDFQQGICHSGNAINKLNPLISGKSIRNS